MPLVIDAGSSQLSRGEPVADTARVLGRQVAAIVWRTFGQDRLEQMAAASGVPGINARTDSFHPFQIPAALQTIRAAPGSPPPRTPPSPLTRPRTIAHPYPLP